MRLREAAQRASLSAAAAASGGCGVDREAAAGRAGAGAGRSLAARLTDGAGRPQLLGAACVRALSWTGTLVVVGTRAGEILTGSRASGARPSADTAGIGEGEAA